jgi:hypothetical protein
MIKFIEELIVIALSCSLIYAIAASFNEGGEAVKALF